MQLRHEPAALILTRQALPTLDRTQVRVGRGPGARAPTCSPMPRAASPTCILMATGSEVSLCVAAHEELAAGRHQEPRGEHALAGSSSSSQPQEYRDAVLPPSVTARVSVELGSTLGWERYVGTHGPT